MHSLCFTTNGYTKRKLKRTERRENYPRDLAIMTDYGDAYEVSCPAKPLVSGIYVRNAATHRYNQKNGIHTLAQHTTGQWGVGDGKVYLFLAKPASERPTDQISWQMLQKDRYVESPTMFVQRLKSPAPPATQSRPTEAAAAVPNAQASHGYVEKAPYVESAKDWTKVTTASGAVVYQNKVTKVQQHIVPEILLNVCAYSVETAEQARIGVYVPLAMVLDAGVKPVDVVHMETWRECEANWAKTLELLEGELGYSQHKLEGMKKSGQSHEEERRTLNETLARMQANLQSGAAKERQALERSEAMTSRLGRGHIKRDEPPPSGPRTFPTGEELQKEYAAVFGDAFEEAAAQATTCMEDVLKMRDSVDFFVYDIIAPLFRVTKAYVTEVIAAKYKVLSDNFGVALEEEEEGEGDQEDSIARQFFLSSQQEVLLGAVMGVDKSVINKLITQMGTAAVKLRDALPTWAARDGSSLTFDLAGMVRLLLRVHTVIELSDPKCYLYPDATTNIVYPEDRRIHREIFSPGTKVYGQLARGEEVQVVVPGLYFQPPTSCAAPSEGEQMNAVASKNGRVSESAGPLVIPVVCAKVRRTINSTTIGNHK
jgi:hypothetical protein